MKGTPAPHITTKPAGARVRVTVKGEVIADSRDAVALKEGDYPVVYYFPRKDVKMDRLERTDHGKSVPLEQAVRDMVCEPVTSQDRQPA